MLSLAISVLSYFRTFCRIFSYCSHPHPPDILLSAGPGTSIRFNPPEDSVFVVEGRQLVVDCIAECSPACTYVWKKGTRQVAQGPTLRFSAITREDAGGYSCFASNDADNQASKPLQVDVQCESHPSSLPRLSFSTHSSIARLYHLLLSILVSFIQLYLSVSAILSTLCVAFTFIYQIL